MNVPPRHQPLQRIRADRCMNLASSTGRTPATLREGVNRRSHKQFCTPSSLHQLRASVKVRAIPNQCHQKGKGLVLNGYGSGALHNTVIPHPSLGPPQSLRSQRSRSLTTFGANNLRGSWELRSMVPTTTRDETRSRTEGSHMRAFACMWIQNGLSQHGVTRHLGWRHVAYLSIYV